MTLYLIKAFFHRLLQETSRPLQLLETTFKMKISNKKESRIEIKLIKVFKIFQGSIPRNLHPEF
jgi:hypothetical protein